MYNPAFNLGVRIACGMEKRAGDHPEVRLSQDPEQVKLRDQALEFMAYVLRYPRETLTNQKYMLNGLNLLDDVYREGSPIRPEMVPFAEEFLYRLGVMAKNPQSKGYLPPLNMVRATIHGYTQAPVPGEADISDTGSPIGNAALKVFPPAAWMGPAYLSNRVAEGGGLKGLMDLVQKFAKKPSWRTLTATSLRKAPSILSTIKGFIKTLLLLDPRKKGLKALNLKDIAHNSGRMGAFMYLLGKSLDLGGDLMRGERDPETLFITNPKMRSLARGYSSLPPSLQQYMPPNWKNLLGIPPASSTGADVPLRDRLKGLSPIVTQFDPGHPLKAGSALLRLLFNAPAEVSNFANAVTDMTGYQVGGLMGDLGREAGVSQLPHFALRHHMKQHPEAYGPATREDVRSLENASREQSLKTIYKDESFLPRSLTSLFGPGKVGREPGAIGNALRPAGTTPGQWEHLRQATGYRPPQSPSP